MHLILHRFRDTAGDVSNVVDFNLPLLHLAPRFGWPHGNFTKIIGLRKLKVLGYLLALFQ